MDEYRVNEVGKEDRLMDSKGKEMNCFNNSYQNKTVLITGHTGFKGSWLAIWLQLLGARVVGYALSPQTDRDNFVLANLSQEIVDIRGDIRDKEKVIQVFKAYEPDYIFHLAAQPIVLTSYQNPVYTYETNVMGTINILEGMRVSSKKQVGIFITTDKCYENKEQIWGYREGDRLGGYDPYSSSKAAAELAIASWRNSFMNIKSYEKHHKVIATARAGNVIGGGDWASNRIIPDCIRSIEANRLIYLRSPQAVRPWQHVLDPLNGYLLLGERLSQEPQEYSGAWNFGPYIHQLVSVEKLVKKMIACYGKGEIEKRQEDKESQHEAGLLSLDISKSLFKLKWQPTLTLDETIEYTVEWYKRYREGNVKELCSEQIKKFMEKMSFCADKESF